MSAVEDVAMAADEARERVDRVRSAVTQARSDLVELWRRRAWVALGYASWDDLCDAEFGVRLALPREERREAVAELRAEGMSTPAIASALRISNATAWRDASSSNEEDRPAKVTGLDGRERPAVQPARPAPVAQSERPAAPPEPLRPVVERPALVAQPDPSDTAVAEYVESGADVRRMQIRHDFRLWIRRVLPFDVAADEMAGLIEDDFEWDELARRRDDLNTYLTALLDARPRGLRVIGGDRG